MAPAMVMPMRDQQHAGPVMVSGWHQLVRNEKLERPVFVKEAASLADLPRYSKFLRGKTRLAVLDSVPPSVVSLLSEWFSAVLTADGAVFLPPDQIDEVLADPNRNDLFVAAVVTPWHVILYRGDLSPLFVPREWFARRGRYVPDFDDVAVTDHGQTVRLGTYEVAADALLYEFDAEFRRRARARELESDPSLGGALRRLRLQRGLSRSDFPGISSKGIARLERNEVRPRPRTLTRIAKRLEVPPEAIATY